MYAIRSYYVTCKGPRSAVAVSTGTGRGQKPQIRVAKKNRMRGFFGYIGPRDTHCDAYVRPFQCGRVVDTVTGHGGIFTFVLLAGRRPERQLALF